MVYFDKTILRRMILFSYGSFRKENSINDTNMICAKFQAGSTEDVTFGSSRLI